MRRSGYPPFSPAKNLTGVLAQTLPVNYHLLLTLLVPGMANRRREILKIQSLFQNKTEVSRRGYQTD